MFTTVYKPKNINEFCGQKQLILNFSKWLITTKKDKKCALITGSYGIGKSLLVELLIKHFNYNPIYLDSDVIRQTGLNNTKVISVLENLIKTPINLNGLTNILILDNFDEFVNSCETGFISEFNKIINNTLIPIVIIQDNIYNPNYKTLFNKCIEFKMIKPSYEEIYNLLYKIIINEGIKIKQSKLHEFYDLSNGDIRYIINLLQYYSLICNQANNTNFDGKNISSLNLFEITTLLFSKSDDLYKKEILYNLNDLQQFSIFENYILSISINQRASDLQKLEYLSNASNSLSCSDYFETQCYLNNEWDLYNYKIFSDLKACTQTNSYQKIKFPKISKILNKKHSKVDLEFDLINKLNKDYNINEEKPLKPPKEPKPPKPSKEPKQPKEPKPPKPPKQPKPPKPPKEPKPPKPPKEPKPPKPSKEPKPPKLPKEPKELKSLKTSKEPNKSKKLKLINEEHIDYDVNNNNTIL